MTLRRHIPLLIAGVLATQAVVAHADDDAAARSQMSEQRRAELQTQLDLMPEPVRQVYIDEHAGDTIPLDATFTDSNGKKVTLGELVDGDVPVILTINYYRCPKLCDLLLNGLADLVDELDLEPGEDYKIVTVGFDPAEPATLAQMKRVNLLGTMDKQAAAGKAWTFLVGDQPAIDAVTEATGFKYTWLESDKQYAHPSALILLSPEGKITRYIYGATFRDKVSTVRLSLVEASEGKVGSPLDMILLTCFHYSPSEGKYTPTVMGIMRIGGALTMMAIAGGIGLLLLREWRKRIAEAGSTPAAAH